MTKAELIFQIAKRAGIPETEAMVFFESFLKKISANINAGGAVHLENLGSFIIKEGVSESLNARRKEPDIEHKISELVIFQPEESFNEAKPNQIVDKDPLVFNIPNLKGEQKSIIDSYFSLSFGKPVVNRNDPNDIEELYPISRNEQKRILEAKAERLFSEVKIYDQFGNESEKYLFVGTQRPIVSSDSEFKPADLHNSNDVINVSDAWDNSKDIQKEIQEKSILDIDIEDDDIDLSQIVKENLAWDFGVEVKEDGEVKITPPSAAYTPEEKTEPQVFPDMPTELKSMAGQTSDDEEEISWDFGGTPDEIAADFASNEIQFEHVPEYHEMDGLKKTGEDLVTEVLKTAADEPSILKEYEKQSHSDFETVNSMTSELQRLTVVEDQLNWDFGRKDENESVPGAPNDTLDETPHDNGFVQISGRNSKAGPNVKYQADASEGPSGFNPVVDFDEEPSIFQKFLKFALFGLIGILAALISVYAYFKFVKHQDLLDRFKNQQIFASTEKQKPEVIERNYEVPVTYPYEKKESEPASSQSSMNMSLSDASVQNQQQPAQNETPAKQPDVSSKQNESLTPEDMFSSKSPLNGKSKKDIKQEKQKEAKKETQKEQKPKQEKPVETKSQAMPKPGEHAFYDGSQYVIQVSSWPSKQKADGEVEKLKKLGYKSFVASAYLEAKKATWYRVRVGGFGSKEEAEKAYSKLFK